MGDVLRMQYEMERERALQQIRESTLDESKRMNDERIRVQRETQDRLREQMVDEAVLRNRRRNADKAVYDAYQQAKAVSQPGQSVRFSVDPFVLADASPAAQRLYSETDQAGTELERLTETYKRATPKVRKSMLSDNAMSQKLRAIPGLVSDEDLPDDVVARERLLDGVWNESLVSEGVRNGIVAPEEATNFLRLRPHETVDLLEKRYELKKQADAAKQQEAAYLKVGQIIQKAKNGQPLSPEEEGFIATARNVSATDLRKPDQMVDARFQAMAAEKLDKQVARYNDAIMGLEQQLEGRIDPLTGDPLPARVDRKTGKSSEPAAVQQQVVTLAGQLKRLRAERDALQQQGLGVQASSAPTANEEPTDQELDEAVNSLGPDASQEQILQWLRDRRPSR